MKQEIKIGDIVALNSNRELPMTVTDVWEKSDFCKQDTIWCKWIDKRGKPHIENFPPNSLTPYIEEDLEDKNSKDFPLLYCDLLGVYGLKIYASLIGSFTHGQDKSLEYSTRFVYNFKKYGKQSERVRQMILAVATHFACDTVVAIPPHTTDPNEMQKLFGQTIVRTKEVSARKYNHNFPLSDDYANSYHINFEGIKGSKILLIDDIVTSGATILHFAQVFENKGFEVIKLGIGLDKKLEIEAIQLITLRNIT